MINNNLIITVNDVIKKYKNNFFSFAYKHSNAVGAELKKILDEDLTKEKLANFFIKQYQGKQYDQPIAILDELALLLNKLYQFDTLELQWNSVGGTDFGYIEENKTLGVYRMLLKLQTVEMQEITTPSVTLRKSL